MKLSESHGFGFRNSLNIIKEIWRRSLTSVTTEKCFGSVNSHDPLSIVHLSSYPLSPSLNVWLLLHSVVLKPHRHGGDWPMNTVISASYPGTIKEKLNIAKIRSCSFPICPIFSSISSILSIFMAPISRRDPFFSSSFSSEFSFSIAYINGSAKNTERMPC